MISQASANCYLRANEQNGIEWNETRNKNNKMILFLNISLKHHSWMSNDVSNFLHEREFFTATGQDWMAMRFLKIPSHQKEQDRNKQKSNLAHACSWFWAPL
jgi:hypothetical protein